MNEESLKKLYDLMRVIIISQNKEAITHLITINHIIWNMINKKASKDDLRWCNEIWKKYKCNKLEDEIDKMVYRKEGSPKLRRTQIVLYEPTSLGYEKDDFFMKRRTFLNNEGEYDGLEIEWYENGNKKGEITWKDDYEDGLWTSWYENRQKKIEQTFKDGKQDGLLTGWYEKGEKIEEQTWKDGKRDGLWTNWYKNRQKALERTYKDGKQDGLGIGWYENGEKFSEVTYKDGKQDGLDPVFWVILTESNKPRF